MQEDYPTAELRSISFPSQKFSGGLVEGCRVQSRLCQKPLQMVCSSPGLGDAFNVSSILIIRQSYCSAKAIFVNASNMLHYKCAARSKMQDCIHDKIPLRIVRLSSMSVSR